MDGSVTHTDIGEPERGRERAEHRAGDGRGAYGERKRNRRGRQRGKREEREYKKGYAGA